MDSHAPTAPLSQSPSSSSKPSPSNQNDDQQNPSAAETQTLILKRKSKPKPIKDPHNQSPAPRRRTKKRVSSAAADDVDLPRKTRKPRKRLEREIVDDDVVGRPRKRRQKNKQPPKAIFLDEAPLELVAHSPTTKIEDGENNAWKLISELVMWKNVAKSTLWFGSGSMFFLSSCFSRDSNVSIISAASHLGILILGIAFFHDSLPQTQRQWKKPREVKFQLTEEDFICAARLILPMANAVLAKCQNIFSGEPSVTLKVAPILLLTAKYGHLITPWRLLATGFFMSFTLPKLYSSYAERIHERVKEVKSYVEEAWKSCPRKKLVATSTAMLLWNLSTVKMRMFAAFMSVVVFRHKKQQTRGMSNEIERKAGELKEPEP